jgi:hypothetical protein
MKKSILISSVLLLLVSSCIKDNSNNNIVIPTGVFAGQFSRVHLNLKTNKLDTLKANITLTLSAVTGYIISGDTTNHAASHGPYSADGQNMYFTDKTLPLYPVSTAPPPVKTHLNGIYLYSYNSSALQLSLVTDTLAFYYNMTLKP